MTHFPRFATMLREAHEQLLQEGPLNPQQMKVKLGIKATAISDEDMQALMDITPDKKQLVALVKYTQEPGADLEDIKGYADKMVKLDPKLDPQRFPTFLKFTEHIDAKQAQVGYAKSGGNGGFDIENTQPDWQSQDGRYRVYEAQGVQDCIKYGQGQTFCISRSGSGNLYSHYRRQQESKYYFVFDTKLKPQDNEYITVVDAHPGGRYEFTHKENDTPKATERYKGDLDNFLRTKPGLEAGKNVFKANPLTNDERAELAYFQDVRKRKEFNTLDRQQKLRYIQFSGYPLRAEEIKTLDKELQNEYLNVTDLLEINERMFAAFLPVMQIRIIKDKIKSGTYFDSEQEFNVIREYPDRIPMTLDDTEAKSGLLGRGYVFSVLLDALHPEKLLRRFTPEQWLQAFTNNPTKAFEAGMKAKNSPAIEAYVGADNLSRIYMAGETAQTIPAVAWLEAFRKDTAQVSMLEKQGIPWEAISNVRDSHFLSVFRWSPIAYDFLRKLLTVNKELTWESVWGDYLQRGKDGTACVNLAATSDNPLGVAKRMNILGDDVARVHWNRSTLLHVLNKPELMAPLVRSGALQVGDINNYMLDHFPDAQVAKWRSAAEAVYNQELERHNSMNENYLLRFKKILNS